MFLQILIYLLLVSRYSAQLQSPTQVASAKDLAAALSAYRIQNIEISGGPLFSLWDSDVTADDDSFMDVPCARVPIC